MGRLQHVCFNNMTYDLKAHIVIYNFTNSDAICFITKTGKRGNKMNIDFK